MIFVRRISYGTTSVFVLEQSEIKLQPSETTSSGPSRCDPCRIASETLIPAGTTLFTAKECNGLTLCRISTPLRSLPKFERTAAVSTLKLTRLSLVPGTISCRNTENRARLRDDMQRPESTPYSRLCTSLIHLDFDQVFVQQTLAE